MHSSEVMRRISACLSRIPFGTETRTEIVRLIRKRPEEEQAIFLEYLERSANDINSVLRHIGYNGFGRLHSGPGPAEGTIQ